LLSSFLEDRRGSEVLKLLLDEHISPWSPMVFAAATGSWWFFVWEDGESLGQQGSAGLKQATAQGSTLVTYDRRTIPPLLKTWREEGGKTV